MTAVSAYLANLNGAAPDMAKLRELGVPLKRAIKICTEHHAPPEPSRVEPAAAPLPKRVSVVKPTFTLGAPKTPLPLPVVTDPEVKARQSAGDFLGEPLPCILALSVLHTLTSLIEAERAEPQQLADVGFSWTTAKEIAWVINQLRNPF